MVTSIGPKSPIDVARLRRLMGRSNGDASLVVGIVDGPIALDHPRLQGARIRELNRTSGNGNSTGPAREHGTFVAGVLTGHRGGLAPAIAPGCTVLSSQIFADADVEEDHPIPSASVGDLAEAIYSCVREGARLVNVSAALREPSSNPDPVIDQVLAYAASRGAIVIAAAGNRATLGSSAVTRHPAVIPVVACDSNRTPLGMSTLSATTARRGLVAPGAEVTSLAPGGGHATWTGTSIATPIVTGALALLWSVFPTVHPGELRRALVPSICSHLRRTVVPPALDAEAAWDALQLKKGKRGRGA